MEIYAKSTRKCYAEWKTLFHRIEGGVLWGLMRVRSNLNRVSPKCDRHKVGHFYRLCENFIRQVVKLLVRLKISWNMKPSTCSSNMSAKIAPRFHFEKHNNIKKPTAAEMKIDGGGIVLRPAAKCTLREIPSPQVRGKIGRLGWSITLPNTAFN